MKNMGGGVIQLQYKSNYLDAGYPDRQLSFPFVSSLTSRFGSRADFDPECGSE
jgi:hypothetical protein